MMAHHRIARRAGFRAIKNPPQRGRAGRGGAGSRALVLECHIQAYRCRHTELLSLTGATDCQELTHITVVETGLDKKTATQVSGRKSREEMPSDRAAMPHAYRTAVQ
jgi:hypothetical protein